MKMGFFVYTTARRFSLLHIDADRNRTRQPAASATLAAGWRVANFVNVHGIQFVASILKDKLPIELSKDEFLVVKLSQKDKLFKIEG